MPRTRLHFVLSILTVHFASIIAVARTIVRHLITDHGAIVDGFAANTRTIQNAIEVCAAVGGRVVVVRSMTLARRLIARLFLLSELATASGIASQAPWTPLFDGRDLSAWTIETAPIDSEREVITVQDGEIRIHTHAPDKICKEHVWMVTKNEYSDFALRMKFQTVRGDRGNSGIQIRSRIDPDLGMQGPQLDLNPPGPWRTGMLYDMTTGVTRFLSPPFSTSEVNEAMAVPGLIYNHAGEGPGWNEIIVTAVGPHITCELNGIKVMDFSDIDNILNDSLHRKYGVGVKGFIAIQVHDGKSMDLRMKDVFIKDLTTRCE